ncbi:MULTISPECIES: transposase [Leuconostoc]|uniref:transposase n=1 Tax=Leuconostoc TaxID=1243 RepID=UPI0024A96FC6|nr:transposase [Leuconostoc falkenbergense]MDI6554126.1 transposase [Leuconostoc falkenbergense]
MKAKRYSTEFKSSIVTLYNEGRSANSLANEYHLAVQTVTGWVKEAQIIYILIWAVSSLVLALKIC